MPIPNVSSLYQRIAKGSEGGHEFARFIKLLLLADYRDMGMNFISESDASGDYRKVDGYVLGDTDFPQNIIGYQFKFFPSNLSSNQKYELKESIKAAISENEFIQDLIIVKPEDWQTDLQTWFDALCHEFHREYWIENEGLTRKCHFKLAHWGHTKIIELALRHDHVGIHYFPELFPLGFGRLKLSKAVVASEKCSWSPFEGQEYKYFICKKGNLTTDPVLDFRFKNSTGEIHLLNRIEVHIDKIWATMKGIPSDELLVSTGMIELEIDFTKKVNEFDFKDPWVFSPHKAKRFHFMLKNFLKCPGNCIQLKFWFFFDELTVPTHSFIFSL